MPNASTTYLLAGSNIEPRVLSLVQAADLIGQLIGPIVDRSSVFESPPWGFEAQTLFLNQVLKVTTQLRAPDVLGGILEIERMMGRERAGTGYSSRAIDIDILYFGEEIIHTDNLVIPHPRLQERRFALAPLAEIAADFVHPILKMSNLDLLRSCPDPSAVTRFS